MERLKIARVLVTLVSGILPSSMTVAYAQGSTNSTAREIAVLTEQEISPARAAHALDVQGKVARANLVSMVKVAMGSEYAGAWLEPAAAQVHFGVTSETSRKAAQQAVAKAGLQGIVIFTPVRSTWDALVTAQHQCSPSRPPRPLARP